MVRGVNVIVAILVNWDDLSIRREDNKLGVAERHVHMCPGPMRVQAVFLS